MDVAFARISSKSQTVIPRKVRQHLGLKPGDRVRFAVTPDGVIISKADDHSGDDPFAVFTEWAGAADEEAYGGL